MASQHIQYSTWGRCLSADDLGRVADSARDVVVAAGEHVVQAGERAAFWVGLIEGVVVQQVTNNAGRITALTCACSGTWFGEGTLMKHGCWQYDAVARRESRVVLVPSETFDWLLRSSLAFNQFIARLLNGRLSHYMGLLANERLTNSEQRVAHVLASLFDADLYPGRPPLLRMSQGDIALLCGLSRQHTNGALQRLQDMGLVELGRTGVRVIDVESLRLY